MTSITGNDRYDRTIREFADFSAAELQENLSALALFGSCARKGGVVDGWSDIDVLLIVRYATQVEKRNFFEFVRAASKRSDIGFTVSLHTEIEIARRFKIVSPINSIVLNALSGRDGTAKVLYGDVRFLPPPLTIEKKNAYSYLHQMSSHLRRINLEGKSRISEKTVLAQLIRWSSSIVRCSLRTKGIFLDPYEPSLSAATNFYPEVSFDLLRKLFPLRHDWSSVAETDASNFVRELDVFLEKFLERVGHF
jgi:predicted nucleotidyltransferase